MPSMAYVVARYLAGHSHLMLLFIRSVLRIKERPTVECDPHGHVSTAVFESVDFMWPIGWRHRYISK